MSDKAQRIFDGGDWWRRDGPFRLLHDINPLRLREAERAAGGSLAGKRLLDVGCGGGIFAEAAAMAGARVRGFDVSEGAVAAARAHAEQSGAAVEYECASARDAAPGSCDLLTCFEVLEHADSPADVVADAAAALKPGGAAVFSTINRTFRAWALVVAGLEHILKILPAGSHDYEKFVAPAELARMCRDCGLEVKRIAGMQYSFFGRAYVLREDWDAVNYFMTAKRPS